MSAGRDAFRRWLGATFAGWVISVPLIALLALAGEWVGIGGSQGLVGLGVGLGVGYFQSRIVRDDRLRARSWLVVTALALTAPFAATDAARALRSPLPYSLGVALAVGGVTASAGQALLIRRAGRGAARWLAASAAGWLAAAALVAGAEPLGRALPLRGIPAALAYLGMVCGGGLALGAITGAARLAPARSGPA